MTIVGIFWRYKLMRFVVCKKNQPLVRYCHSA